VHKLAQSVLGHIRKHNLLRPGDRVGVAVSGGADSVALLRILLDLRRELGIVVSVVHLNHKLRGAESDEDECFVRQLANTHDLQLICESCAVKSRAARKKLSLETAARQLRYEFFARALLSGQMNKIATAHTIDDQAETVLLKLARGAGTRGLAGIYPKISVSHLSSDISQDGHKPPASAKSIVRPLLLVRRHELEAYLAEIGQPWREDSSNRELRHTRNRVRHEILPRLAELVNPRVHETLAEAAEIARSEEEFWSKEVAKLLPRVWKPCGNGGSISRKSIDKFPLAVQRRLVRAAAESLGLNLEFNHVEEVLNLGQENARAALPQNWSATFLRGEIKFSGVRRETVDYAYTLSVPGKIAVPEANLTVEAQIVPREKLGDDSAGQMVDLNFIKNGLIVRNWRAGDRFWPENTKEPKKIKELLQDRHITGDQKKSWPVLAIGNEIVWVRDLGIRREFRAKGDKGLLIKYSQTTPTMR
jgi:tRNA(Ile)-lysidine synthase